MTVQAVLDDLRKRPGTGDVITVIDPATEETITEFTDCGQEAVNEAPRGRRRRSSRVSGPTFPAASGPRSCGGLGI